MVLETIPLTSAGRPPFGGPPIGTTFSNQPDDRDDMLTTLRDNVQRLVNQAEKADGTSAAQYFRLLDQRRNWIRDEIDAEGLLSETPKAPLGIPENPYDLSSLSIEPIDARRRTYDQIVVMIDQTMATLWERMLTIDEADPTV